MGRKLGRPKAGQELLTRERILETALRLIDLHGVEAFSMRRVAADLGVDPMAIYYHLPGKPAVLAGVVELVCAGLQLPPPGIGAWQERVRAVAESYRGLVRAHRNIALYLIADAEASVSAALEVNEALFEALLAAGLPPREVVRAADLVVDYVHGFALAEASGPVGASGERRELLAGLGRQPTGRFPALRGVLGGLNEDELRADFAAGLDIILAGIAARALSSQGLGVGG
jgi:TetR/AcrR family transcriptional regulator, tetracycline repressor protein